MEADRTWLFSPGDVFDRCLKALKSGADQVIWDLEDGVGPDHKEVARDTLRRLLPTVSSDRVPWVRIQSLDDLDVLDNVGPRPRWVVPKIDGARFEQLQQIARDHPRADREWLLLVESARGLWDLFHSPEPWRLGKERLRLAFGSLDFLNDIAGQQTGAETELLGPRTVLPWISRAWDLAGPIDGVYPAIDDAPGLKASTARARTLGFAGRMIIHPRQISPVHETYRPSDAERQWATAILSAKTEAAVVRIQGQMVDRPVIERARRIHALALQYAERKES